MVKLVIVRHGQVEWNRVARFRGRVDLPLNATGVRQAQALAQRLAEEFAVDAIYSSPLQRARHTAEAIGQAVGKPVALLEGLNDLHYGEWQGQTPEEVAQRYPMLYDQWLNEPHKLQFPGGETLDQVGARAMAAVEEVASRHEGQTVVLASHLGVCKVLLCVLLGLGSAGFWSIEQGNTALNVVHRERGRYVVERLNDTCHLRGLD